MTFTFSCSVIRFRSGHACCCFSLHTFSSSGTHETLSRSLFFDYDEVPTWHLLKNKKQSIVFLSSNYSFPTWQIVEYSLNVLSSVVLPGLAFKGGHTGMVWSPVHWPVSLWAHYLEVCQQHFLATEQCANQSK